MSVGRAILVGMIWVNGAVLAAFLIPLLVVATGGIMIADPSKALANLATLVAGLILGFVCSWAAWSSQVTRWRLWAYRRVTDIDALKSQAVASGLIWPEGHFFERTELRSRDEAAELARLEVRGSARHAIGAPLSDPTPVTRWGAIGKALLIGLILTPVSVFAPAGALSFMGIDVTESPIFFGLVVLFPLVLAAAIYSRARRDKVSADEAFRSLLPGRIRREDGET